MEMTITFPGGEKVNAEMNEVVIPTDQPSADGKIVKTAERCSVKKVILTLRSLSSLLIRHSRCQ